MKYLLNSKTIKSGHENRCKLFCDFIVIKSPPPFLMVAATVYLVIFLTQTYFL